MPPSHVHEGLTELFRDRPALAAEILTTLFGLALPRWRNARLAPTDLNTLAPAEYHADAVINLTDPADRPVASVVVEVQLGRDSTRTRPAPLPI